MARPHPGAASATAAASPTAPWRRHLPAWGWIAALFLLSRLAAHLAGLRFDASPLGWGWQLVDPVLLQHRLAESLLYLHSQPPLFNLYLGIVLKLAGQAAPAVFAATFRLGTLVAWVAAYHLLLYFRLPRWAAVAAPSLYFLGSTALVYESWLFYTWPVAVLLVLAAGTLALFLLRPGVGPGLAFFTLLATTCLVRSSFHLVWGAACLALLLVARPRLWRLVLRSALIPLLLVVAVYAKNYAVFSTFSASSWMWLSLYKMASYSLVEDSPPLRPGQLSPLVAVRAFAPPEEYAQVMVPLLGPPPHTGIPILDEARKSTGEPNFNHLLYLRSLPFRRHDTLTLIRLRPSSFAGVLAASCVLYPRSPDDHFAVRDLAAVVESWRRLWEPLVYGSLPRRLPGGGAMPVPLQHLGVLVVVSLFALFGACLVVALRRRRRPWRNDEVVFLFLATTVGYSSLVGILLEVVENNRFRVMIEPLLLVAAAVMVHRLAARLRGRRRRRNPEKEPGTLPNVETEKVPGTLRGEAT